jgi:hypothetical protein
MNAVTTPHYMSLCCIIKDEDDVIEEWVAFHLSVGVDHILLIDNGPSKNLPTILAPYIAAGKVELVHFWSRGRQQQRAYDRALRYMSGKTRWLGFIDADEFLFPSSEKDLPTVFRDFEDYVAVSVNWVAFGSNGHQEPPPGFVIENFTDRGELDHRLPMTRLRDTSVPDDHPHAYLPMNTHVKTVVDPSRTIRLRTAHHYKYLPGLSAVTENKTPIDAPVTQTVSINRLRINHYWSKSLDQLLRKISKGAVESHKRKTPHNYAQDFALERDRAASGVTDTEILRFLPQLNATIAHYRQQPSSPLPPVRRLRYQPQDWLVATWREVKRFVSRAKRGKW